MTFLQQLLGTSVRANNPLDDRFYESALYSPAAASGMRVSPETALKISTVWACVALLSETIASLPAMVYRRLASGGRERADGHPLFDVLHTRPNAQQTAFEFFDMMTGHVLLRGNGYAKIVPGPRGPADQLVPLHPDRVRLQDLPDGRLRYKVREKDARGQEVENTYLDEDILHLKGRTLDGRTGLSVVAYARESFGLALAAEGYGARFFGNDARPGGVLKMAGKLSPEGQTKLKASWEDAHRGVGQSHRVAVLEEGLEWQAVGLHNKDSQFLETREFQAEDICRWFRVPPHMVGLTSKVTSWGTGIEQLGQAFVTYTLLPWLVRWQQAISRDLIIAPNVYFVEFVTDALLRGATLDRYNAYAIARNNGWLSVNEIRQRENLNPIGDGDGYLQPLNMQELGTPRPPEPAGAHTVSGALRETSGHYEQLVQEAAGRVVRKEIAALSRAAKRNGTAEAWPAAVDEFFADHSEFVAQSMRIPPDQAERYVAWGRAALQQNGPDAMADWEPRRVAQLVGLALDYAVQDRGV